MSSQKSTEFKQKLVGNHNYHGRFSGLSRAEKSLTALTTKFMTLLQESPNGVLDLRSLVESIPSRQKRRVYDITNVLEGIGLIEKFSKNSIRCKHKFLENYQKTESIDELQTEIVNFFRGGGPNNNNTPDELDKLGELKTQVCLLDKQEKCLDEQIKIMRTNREFLLLDDVQQNRNYFLTHDDLINAFPNAIDAPADTLVFVKISDKTQVELPEPMYVFQNSEVKPKYQLNIRSQSSPLQVFLVNNDKRLSDKIKQEPITKNDAENIKSPANQDEDGTGECDRVKENQKTVTKKPQLLIPLEPVPSSNDYTFVMGADENLFDIINGSDPSS